MAASTKTKGKKKPLSQDDLRKLMKEQKHTKKTTAKRIESPLAKYNSIGQLLCVVCTTQVKSELLWNAHIQGRTHKENVAALKAKNEEKNTATVPLPPGLPPGILKRTKHEENSSSSKRAKLQESDGASKGLPSDFFDDKSEAKKVKLALGDYSSSDEEMDAQPDRVAPAPIPPPTKGTGLPADFFDPALAPSGPKDETEEAKLQSMADKLPEGFFDDPKMDAKVRQVEYRDKMEDEWEMFQRAMKEETIKSEALQEEDDEAIITERNIEEIDDQLHRWGKVDSLAKIKEKLVVKETVEVKPEVPDGIIEDECSDDDGDRLDWRIT